jgi:hypothetical protein
MDEANNELERIWKKTLKVKVYVGTSLRHMGK